MAVEGSAAEHLFDPDDGEAPSGPEDAESRERPDLAGPSADDPLRLCMVADLIPDQSADQPEMLTADRARAASVHTWARALPSVEGCRREPGRSGSCDACRAPATTRA
jgi:hypothetical protein